MPFANIPPSLWDEDQFVRLSDRAQILWLYLTTGPEAQNAAVPGLLLTGVAALAEGRRQSAIDVHSTLAELLQDGWVEVDGPHRLIRVPRAPWLSPPSNPNVLLGWWRRWQLLPPSPLKMVHLDSLHEVATNLRPFAKMWAQTFGSIVRLITNETHPTRKHADKWASVTCDGTYKQVSSLPEDLTSPDLGGLGSSGTLPKEFLSDPLTEVGSPTQVRSLTEVRSPDADPDPDPEGSARGGKLADGNRTGNPANVFQQAKALWNLQEELLSGLSYETVPREATAADLGIVVAALNTWTVAQLEHAQRFLARRAEDDSVQAKWFNRRSNWSRKQLEFAVDAPIAPASGGRVRAVRRVFGGSALPP